MKFTKLIKVILPLATISAVAPFIANCGCGNNTYVINYGDNVDCINKGAKEYHKLDDVRKAIINKANRETASYVSIETITNNINTEMGIQCFYYDIIAGATVVEQWEMQITNWKATKTDNEYRIDASFNFGSGLQPYNGLKPSYVVVDGAICVQFNTTKVCRSYTYQNCRVQ